MAHSLASDRCASILAHALFASVEGSVAHHGSSSRVITTFDDEDDHASDGGGGSSSSMMAFGSGSKRIRSSTSVSVGVVASALLISSAFSASAVPKLVTSDGVVYTAQSETRNGLLHIGQDILLSNHSKAQS